MQVCPYELHWYLLLQVKVVFLKYEKKIIDIKYNFKRNFSVHIFFLMYFCFIHFRQDHLQGCPLKQQWHKLRHRFDLWPWDVSVLCQIDGKWLRGNRWKWDGRLWQWGRVWVHTGCPLSGQQRSQQKEEVCIRSSSSKGGPFLEAGVRHFP